MILIDTQILIWATTDIPPKASREVRATSIFRDRYEQDFAVSATSVWEVAMTQKTVKRRLDLGGSLRSWYAGLGGIPGLTFLPVTPEIALRSRTAMPVGMHDDPGDRFILATALTHGLPLLTTDEKLIRLAPSAVMGFG